MDNNIEGGNWHLKIIIIILIINQLSSVRGACAEISIATPLLETTGFIVFCYVLVDHNKLWFLPSFRNKVFWIWHFILSIVQIWRFLLETWGMVKYNFQTRKKSLHHTNIKCAHIKDFVKFIKNKKVRC